MGFIGLCTQTGVERAPGVGDWKEGKIGGGGGEELGRQASFDHSDKVSEGKKSRKSQTNKHPKKVEEKAG